MTVERIGVLGAGVMGGGIAQVCATAGFDVVVYDIVATTDEVDQLMTDCYRWPTGPFGMVKGAGSGWTS